jgi:polysaccharide biosynthesis protein PslH
VRVRPYQWIRSLTGLGHHVHVVALRPPEDRWANPEDLRHICDELDLFDVTRVQTLVNVAGAVLTGSPLQMAYATSRAGADRVTQLAASGRFDVVHVEHLRGVALAGGVRGVPVVYDAVDSITALFEQASTQAPGWSQRLMARLDLTRTRRFESSVPFRFQRTLVTSQAEADIFVRLAGADARSRLAVLPNGVDLEYFTPAPMPREGTSPRIILSGKMSYHANEAAALWLVHDIMPRVWARRPDATVVLAGKDPGPAVQGLAGPRVEVTGFLEDLREELWRATVAVAPLRYGAGIQNKVLEAMACGLPVVTTSAVIRALDPSSQACVAVADTGESIADALVGLLGSAERLRTTGHEARAHVERHHNWNKQARRLADVYRAAHDAA